MSVLLDLSQVAFASIAQERATNRGPKVKINKDLAMHFIMNSIRHNNMKFRGEYGEMIIAADSRSWRKDYFPNYKIRRGLVKQEDDEFETVIEVMHQAREILINHSPFRVIKVNGAEADDIIGHYCNVNGVTDDDFGGIGAQSEKILIISGDKDFQQLQKYNNVTQFSPTLKKFLKCEDAKRFRMEHVARGDAGDDIPNILSPDDVFITEGARQKPVTKGFLEGFVAGFDDPINIPTKIDRDTFLRNYSRNLTLVDLIDNIPTDLQEKINIELDKPANAKLEDLRTTFIALRMRNLLDCIGDFKVNR